MATFTTPPVVAAGGTIKSVDINAVAQNTQFLKDTTDGLLLAKKHTAQPLSGALTRVSANLASVDDSNPGTFRIIGLGSSVGAGATLPTPATQAPVAQLAAKIVPILIPLGNKPAATTNGSVNGTSILDGFNTDYATAKTNAGGTPNLLVLAYGMNDGMPGAYNTGQTYPAVYNYGKQLVTQAQNDGADVIIFTTPHPRTDIMTDSQWAVPGTSSYPSTTPIPAGTKAASVVQVKNADGVTVSASYRHLRVNEALRRLALDTGSVLVDVEKYWLKAIAQYGLAALFDSGEYAHPNVLGHQVSYGAASDELATSLTVPSLRAVTKPAGYTPLITYKATNFGITSSTTLVNDDQLSVAVGPNQVWEIDLSVYFTGTNGDLRVGFSMPTGAAGRNGVHGPGINATGFESHTMTARSVTLPDTYGLPVGANDADAFALYKALILTGANGGTIVPQWCQNSSNAAATTIYASTYMKATRVA